jgi:hypothetical protein
VPLHGTRFPGICARGDYPAAKAALRKALSGYEQTGQVEERLEVQRALASVLAGSGDPQGALDLLRQAEQLADSASGMERGPCEALRWQEADLAVAS